MPLVRRGTALIATLSCAAAFVAGCATLPGTPQAEGLVAPGLARFYTQDLNWGSCLFGYATDADSLTEFGATDVPTQCARLTVPLDYAHPDDGQTMRIGLLRVTATDPAHRVGSLVIDPGGPGASGMTAAEDIARLLRGTQLAADFDLVGFDPRGVGASIPAVHCLTDAQQDAQRLELPLDDPAKEAAREQAENQQYAQDCAQRTGDAVLANIGTRDVAKDVDVLRAALGDAKLTYLGYSYGTKIGTQYAEDFPQNVRAMILDGAVDPDESANAENAGQQAGFAAAFTAFATWCARQKHCGLGDSPSDAQSALDALDGPLLAHNLPVGSRALSYSDVQTAVDAALYSPQDWSTLNTGLLDLARKKGGVLLALADSYDDRGPDGRYSNEQDVFTAVRCVDYPPVTDKNVLEQQEQAYDRANGIDPSTDPYIPVLDPCAFWPVPNTSSPHVPKVTGLPPVLVISTTHDPATPYQSGVNLAHDLHAQLLTFDGTQHTAFLDGNACVDRWGSDYLLRLTAVPTGTTCGK